MANVTLVDNTLQFNGQLDTLIHQWLEESAGELESQVKRNSAVALVAGGKTKNDWQHVVDESQQKAIVGNPNENAIWEEFGTGEYALHGDGRIGGWYIPIGDGEGFISQAVVDAYHFPVVHGKNGMSYAFTRGKKPKRALENARVSCEDSIKLALQMKLNRLST